jgi:hypothetical protein
MLDAQMFTIMLVAGVVLFFTTVFGGAHYAFGNAGAWACLAISVALIVAGLAGLA